MTIRVMLADDHQMFRDALRGMLDGEVDLQVVDEAGDGSETLIRCSASRPDVVVMDISMGEPDGIETTKRLLRLLPQAKVVALSCHADKRHVARMIEAGAAGYITKSAASVALVNAIRAVHNQRTYFCQEVADALADVVRYQQQGGGNMLGRREIEVLTLLADGKHAPEIGEKLHISPSTVEAHRRNIMRKLDLHSVVDLTKYALREGLIQL